MQYYQHVGIAIATAIASWVNSILLFIVLYKSKQIIIDLRLKKLIRKILVMSFIFGYGIFYFKDLLNTHSNYQLFYLIIFVLIGMFFFGILCLFFRIFKFSDLKLIKKN